MQLQGVYKCYFACSSDYWRLGATVGIEQGYGEIAVAVFA